MGSGRSRALAATGLIALAALAVVPARATTRTVAVHTAYFDPAGLLADTGDTVTWQWDGSTHNVTAWQNASFASGDRSSGTYSITYDGSSIKYRCTIHSSLTPDYYGYPTCSGMCATINRAADTTPPPPPLITSPASGATLGSTLVTVSGSASLDTASVRILESGALMGTAAPVSGAWTTKVPFANGSHTIQARSRDAAGNESGGSNLVSFTVSDTTPPGAPSITAPSGNAQLRTRTVDVSLSASADTVLARVRESGVVLKEIGGGGSAFSAGIAFADGPHTITATALDSAGNESTASASVSFFVDATAPAVAITSPGNNSVVVRPFTVTGTSSDNDAVVRVRLRASNYFTAGFFDFEAACTGCGTPNASWTVIATMPSPGVFKLTANAWDRLGNERATAPVTVVAA